MQTVNVPLGERSYEVAIGFDMLAEFGRTLRERALAQDNIAVFTSPRVGARYYDPLEAGLKGAEFQNIGRWDIPDGEENKNLDQFVEAVRWLARFAPRPDVRPVAVTLGGGVVGDLGGFAAAAFRRGIPYVQVPTTLLAAVDSSVGGKTAVNLPEGKNLVGAFHQPCLVHVDLSTLKTLPRREVASGLGEVVKYGVALDAELFEFLEKSIDELRDLQRGALERVVPRCVELKADVVRRDELDQAGVRICLNFGHTIGHAVERATAGALTHGECVAIGMVAETRMSAWTGLCDEHVVDRVVDLVRKADLPLRAEGLDPDRVLEYMQYDKKFTTGRNRFVLLTGIGEWTERQGVPMDVVRDAVEEAIA
ncbi:MAG: 3-dehydroquinate synthase [Planctomycetota bacterium]